MAANAIENFARWNLQIVLLAIVAMVLVRLLRIHAPVLRHAVWRAILVVCLALPLLQPWRSTTLTGSLFVLDGADTVSVAGGAGQSAAAGTARSTVRLSRFFISNWPALAATVLMAGVFLRLVWLALGIYRLQRIRRAGTMLGKSADCDEIEILIEAGAEIRRVERLGQPVTFGIFSPAVLLPESFARMPRGVQRAVLAHELWHVRRRDWMWVLIEEGIRAAFWFNPAMWWVISRVQSSREEVVDELTIQLTDNRQTYLEALLAFADEPTLFPATPFARRRELFHRMLLISREAVMSSKKIVASSICMAAALLTTGVYASSMLPLRAAAVPAAAPADQSPPRDRRPGEAGPETARERQLKQAVESGAANTSQLFELAQLQEARGALPAAEATLIAATRVAPVTQQAFTTLAAFYNRANRFDDSVAALEQAAALAPADPKGYQLLATFYWEKASKDQSLSESQRRAYIDSGINATDAALSANATFAEAMVYKNLLLRLKANMETDAARRQALIAEADGLRSQAMELRKANPQTRMSFAPAPGQPPPPPPPPPPPAELLDGQAPVRVGGNIKPPVKTRDAKPEYPPAARDGGVQGVVIMEATIGPAGDVVEARVLRGQPLLDQAALDAVRQWQFTPTLLNGVAVPVIMTVTVNFTLQ